MIKIIIKQERNKNFPKASICSKFTNIMQKNYFKRCKALRCLGLLSSLNVLISVVLVRCGILTSYHNF